MTKMLGLAAVAALMMTSAATTGAVAAPAPTADIGQGHVLEAKSSKASRPAKRKIRRPYCSQG